MLGMNGCGIFPGVHYADNTTYPMYRYAEGSCPRAHLASERLISLPMHLSLTRADIRRVAHALASTL